MKRITRILENLASTALKAVPLATVFACVTLGSGNLSAEDICAGGSVIAAGGYMIGCAFTTWGPAQQSMCNGATVFSGPNSKNCHICLTAPYAAQVAANNFTGLSTSPAFDFHCLKCTPPPKGLTAWWTLDEPSGISTVQDFTGQVANGVRYGATAVPGHDAALGEDVRNANHFNGVNEYLEIPPNTQLDVGPGAAGGSGDFSIDAWVKIDPGANASGVRVIAEKRTFNPPSQYKGYSFYLYNQYLAVQLADGGTAPGYANYGAASLVVPADGNWHFVAVSVAREPGTFDVQFTLDNTAVVSVSSPVRDGDLTNASPFRIGMETIGTASVFDGSIDEVEFFSRALASSEWQSIYNAQCYGKCKY